MIDQDTRTALLKLAEQGHGAKAIARAMSLSRNTVKKVLKAGTKEVPGLEREEQLETHLDLVRELHAQCEGNLVRVHEKLADEKIEVAYSTLTDFCRRHEIGVKEKQRAGEYHFRPAQEMQHDTSPHDVMIEGKKVRMQCASLVLCYSRRQYAQLYPKWTRLEARTFLSDAISYVGGAAQQCMLDNSTVIMVGGTGKNAVPAPAMKAFSDNFGFTFVAHTIGDADRSGRVERPFHFIENNFYKGRVFESLEDLNQQLVLWLETNFVRYRKRLKASPAQLFVAEQNLLKALPLHVPEAYNLHGRKVDVEGYVNLHTNRYSVDTVLIGKVLEVRETLDRVRFFDGHRLVGEREKAPFGAQRRLTLPEHKGESRRKNTVPQASPDELLLRKQGAEMVALIDALQKRFGGRGVRAVKQLHRLWTDYPAEPVQQAIAEALRFGLTDLARIETMILARIAGDFFLLKPPPEDPHE